ncbi:MAG: type II toxin-antitoxin system HicA family toxin [Solirubrobacteraceae bacterium]
MSKPPRLKYSAVAHQLRKHGAYFVREGGNHEIWRCPCGQHQSAVPRHGDVSSSVVDKIGQQMKCLGKEWWK